MKMERWKYGLSGLKFLEVINHLPNGFDIGISKLSINYCLWNKDEHFDKLSVAPSMYDIPSLEKNSIIFSSEGLLMWDINSSDPVKLEFSITEDEFDNAYTFIVWADPLATASFYDDEKYWKGVLIKEDINAHKKDEELDGGINHIIDMKVKIGQSVVSYFIDLVQKYSTDSFEELKYFRERVGRGEMDALGRLGVMGPSIEDNDTCSKAFGINAFEGVFGDRGVDLYDYDYYKSEHNKVFGPDDECNISGFHSEAVKWGQSNISIYDFKFPIKELYGSMFRIGNDGRIYSNEGLSNLNWGIVGRQAGLEQGVVGRFAAMDPRSQNDDHDDLAAKEGHDIAERAATSSTLPASLSRRTLFFQVLTKITSNDLFTCAGAQRHKLEKERQQREKVKEVTNSMGGAPTSF